MGTKGKFPTYVVHTNHPSTVSAEVCKYLQSTVTKFSASASVVSDVEAGGHGGGATWHRTSTISLHQLSCGWTVTSLGDLEILVAGILITICWACCNRHVDVPL